MRTKEAEISNVMSDFHMNRAGAIEKIDRMVRWATNYKRFVEIQLSREDLLKEQERIKTWLQ
jgi:hypothetical protein